MNRQLFVTIQALKMEILFLKVYKWLELLYTQKGLEVGCNLQIYLINPIFSSKKFEIWLHNHHKNELKSVGNIKALYNLGARKFGIISVAPIGCCPSQRIHNATGGCLEIENTFAQAFYSSLYALLKKLSCELPGMKYALGNSYEMTINVINNPQLFSKKNY